VKLALRIAIASAALAALVAPTLALGQGGVPTLGEAQDSEFPDRVYLYRTPEPRALTASNLDVTENGGPVSGLSVDSGTKSSGAILLIDASNSMAGAPIAGAMEAARAFMAERRDELPVAVIAYNPEITVLTDFTTDAGELSAAVAEAPTLAEGTRIYDALIEAADIARSAGYARTTAVLLSDGHRRGVQASRADALAALNEANVRVISVGLQSPQYDPETLQSMARRTGGTYVESATPGQLEPIFAALERIRRVVPVAARAERASQGLRSSGRVPRRDHQLYDSRARLHRPRHIPAKLDRRCHHVALVDGVRDHRGTRARRVRAPDGIGRAKTLAQATNGAVRDRAYRGGVATASR